MQIKQKPRWCPRGCRIKGTGFLLQNSMNASGVTGRRRSKHDAVKLPPQAKQDRSHVHFFLLKLKLVYLVQSVWQATNWFIKQVHEEPNYREAAPRKRTQTDGRNKIKWSCKETVKFTSRKKISKKYEYEWHLRKVAAPTVNELWLIIVINATQAHLSEIISFNLNQIWFLWPE